MTPVDALETGPVLKSVFRGIPRAIAVPEGATRGMLDKNEIKLRCCKMKQDK
jgi:hypothetical protein